MAMSTLKLLRRFSSAPQFEFLKYQTTNSLKFEQIPKRIPMFRVLDHQGNASNPAYETLDQQSALKIFNIMITNRVMDDLYNTLQRQGRITFYMKTLKEEAAMLSATAALKNNEDVLYLQNRESSPVLLWRGWNPTGILHSLQGTALCKGQGRDMPMLYAEDGICIAPMQGPLGANIIQGVGTGYYFRHKKLDRISVSSYGEGAASEGDGDVSYNFAATLKSQSLFLCRNNLYSISQLANEQYTGDGIVGRGLAYGIPSIRVDGNDVLAVYNAAKEARKLIIERRAPVLIEMMTYRGGDHSTSDLADYYRTPEVLASMHDYLEMIGDPIDRWEKYLLKKGWVSNQHRKKQEGDSRAECLKAIKEVFVHKFPNPHEMFNYTYTEKTWNIIEQEKELFEMIAKYKEAYPTELFKMD